jgi:hypothetical protein
MVRRHALAGALAACAAFTSGHAAPLDYIGQQIVPTGTMEFGTTVGGLSGIDYDPGTGTYWVISDDRSALQPARFYNLSLDLSRFDRGPAPGRAGVTINSVTGMLRPDGTTFPRNQVDPESIRLRDGRLFWTSEGARGSADAQSPFVREMQLDGEYVRELATPARYNPVPGPPKTGIRNNLAFESLSFDASGKRLYTATENALVQDGLPATVLNGTPSRVLAFDRASGNPVAEYVYVTEPVAKAPVPINGFADNGLVELLAVSDMQFLAIERSFSRGVGTTIRIYLADLSGATDVSTLETLAGQPYTPMRKALLLDLATLTNSDGTPVLLDNIEGVTFGPELHGKPTLILVADNNFSSTQFTQFLAFSVSAPLAAIGARVGAPCCQSARARRATWHAQGADSATISAGKPDFLKERVTCRKHTRVVVSVAQSDTGRPGSLYVRRCAIALSASGSRAARSACG